MRLLSTALIAVMLISAGFARAAAAAPVRPEQPGDPVMHQQQPQGVDDNDDSRVTVQLIVAGLAVGVVVVLGSGAYLLRKKLGLVAPPPQPGSDAPH